jgi:hypothetical protein
MPRVCTVCIHPRCAEIDSGLVLQPTESKPQVAKRYGLSEGAIVRHFKLHIPARLARRAERLDNARTETFADLVSEYRSDILRLGLKAEAAGDIRTAISAKRELIRLLELSARAEGSLRAPSSPAVTVNVQNNTFSQADAVRWAKLTLEIAEDERLDLLNASQEGTGQ